MSRMRRIWPLRFQNAIDSGIFVSFIQNVPRTSPTQRNAMPELRARVRRFISPCRSCAGVSAIWTRT